MKAVSVRVVLFVNSMRNTKLKKKDRVLLYHYASFFTYLTA